MVWYENSTDWIDNREELTFTYGGLVAGSSDIDNSNRITTLEIFDSGIIKIPKMRTNLKCLEIF